MNLGRPDAVLVGDLMVVFLSGGRSKTGLKSRWRPQAGESPCICVFPRILLTEGSKGRLEEEKKKGRPCFWVLNSGTRIGEDEERKCKTSDRRQRRCFAAQERVPDSLDGPWLRCEGQRGNRPATVTEIGNYYGASLCCDKERGALSPRDVAPQRTGPWMRPMRALANPDVTFVACRSSSSLHQPTRQSMASI